MSPTRLFILGVLARRGPMHGHHMRRMAEQERMERWADVSVGGLYGALKRMAAEGVIAVHATEQEGNLPPRTVYAVTEEGRAELVRLRAEALGETRQRPDPVELALQYSQDLPPEELRRMVEERQLALIAQLDSWTDLMEHAASHLHGLEPVIIRHTLHRLRAEIVWHTEIAEHLDREAGAEQATDDT